MNKKTRYIEITKKKDYRNIKILEIMNKIWKKYSFEIVDKFHYLHYLGITITEKAYERGETQERIAKG